MWYTSAKADLSALFLAVVGFFVFVYTVGNRNRSIFAAKVSYRSDYNEREAYRKRCTENRRRDRTP